MRSHKGLTTILFLTLTTILTTAQGQDKKPSDTRAASCIVRITADPAILPLNERTVMNLLSSSDVGRDPIRQIVGTEVHGDLSEFIEIEWLSGTLQRTGHSAAGRTPTGRTEGATYRAGRSRLGGMTSGGVSAGAARAGKGSIDLDRLKDDAVEAGMMGRVSMGDPSAGGMGMMGAGIEGMSGMGGMSMGGVSGAMVGGNMGMIGGGTGFGAGGEQIAPGALQQNVTFGLSVNLPEEANAAAEELLDRLIENMRKSLDSAYERYESQLYDSIMLAERKQEGAQDQLNELTDFPSANERVRVSLRKEVNLSMFSTEMPFGKAIDAIKSSINPPLPIVVLWRELGDNASIDADSTIGRIDPQPEVRLESALKILLRSMKNNDHPSELFYRVDNDVIFITTEKPSIETETTLNGVSDQVDTMDLIQQRRELVKNIREYQLRIATSEARQKAIHMQIDKMRSEATQKLKEDSVAQELNRLVKLSEMNLQQIEQQFQSGRIPQTALTDAQKKIAEAKIDLARRREELGLSAGGRQLTTFSEELSKLTIDMVENKTALEILRKQLAQVDQQLAQARVSDPRARQIQTAQLILQITEQHVVALNRQLTNLQRPIVTRIGMN